MRRKTDDADLSASVYSGVKEQIVADDRGDEPDGDAEDVHAVGSWMAAYAASAKLPTDGVTVETSSRELPGAEQAPCLSSEVARGATWCCARPGWRARSPWPGTRGQA